MADNNNLDNIQPSSIHDDFTKYLDQWNDMMVREEQQKQFLASMISEMVAILESGDPGKALQVAEMAVMPTAMETIGSKIGISGSVENIASNVRSMISNLQNQFNLGGNISVPQARDLINTINEVVAVLHEQYALAKNPDTKDKSPLSENVLDSLLGSLKTIGQTLTGNSSYDPSKGDQIPPVADSVVAENMKKWFNPTPSEGKPAAPGFAPEINQITTSFQTMTGQVGTVSTTQTSNTQYLNNLYNQLQAAMSQIAQTTNGEKSSYVRNQLAR